MTTKGSCMCGSVKYEFTGGPAVKAICHCTDCQKWSGGVYTTNVGVPRTSFTLLSGKNHLKTYDGTGDSGKTNKHYFCSNCGSSLYTELEVVPTMMFIKAGGLDGGKADLGSVDVELYVKDRVGFLDAVPGAKQDPKMEY
ncbi:Mss4-like protein [Hyaloscypha finlandica]|nr:Mss4-like protein [Hyaloscypha finlandica]